VNSAIAMTAGPIIVAYDQYYRVSITSLVMSSFSNDIFITQQLNGVDESKLNCILISSPGQGACPHQKLVIAVSRFAPVLIVLTLSANINSVAFGLTAVNANYSKLLSTGISDEAGALVVLPRGSVQYLDFLRVMAKELEGNVRSGKHFLS
jgi:hypothetical protein